MSLLAKIAVRFISAITGLVVGAVIGFVFHPEVAVRTANGMAASYDTLSNAGTHFGNSLSSLVYTIVGGALGMSVGGIVGMIITIRASRVPKPAGKL